MPTIILMAVIGILFLQASGAIPQSSVGGPMTIALAVLIGALAVGINEARTKQRGVPGSIVSIVVAFAGAFLVAPLGGMAMALLLQPFTDGATSLAAAGGLVMAVAVAGAMVVTLLGSWGALALVGRWR